MKIAENVLCAQVCEVSISVADFLKKGCFLLAHFKCESRSPAYHCTADNNLFPFTRTNKQTKRLFSEYWFKVISRKQVLIFKGLSVEDCTLVCSVKYWTRYCWFKQRSRLKSLEWENNCSPELNPRKIQVAMVICSAKRWFTTVRHRCYHVNPTVCMITYCNLLSNSCW